jgi:hypothetical protein
VLPLSLQTSAEHAFSRPMLPGESPAAEGDHARHVAMEDPRLDAAR